MSRTHVKNFANDLLKKFNHQGSAPFFYQKKINHQFKRKNYTIF